MGAYSRETVPSMTAHSRPLPLALTMGDPAGVGPFLTQQAWHHFRKTGPVFFWVGDPALIGRDVPVKIISLPEQALDVFSQYLPVIPVSCPVRVQPGMPDPDNANAVIRSIDHAVEAAQSGLAGAVVTNPIAKHILAEAGFSYPGHTEYLAHLCQVPGQEIMMLACPELRVVLTSVHVSLRQSLDSLNRDHIIAVTMRTHAALKNDFGLKEPRIAMAGINPHAGEKGLMGDEETLIIEPAVRILRDRGLDVSGPFPPDTLFSAVMRPHYDVAICHYHDQGLIPIKTLDMVQGVNVTLGLPIIRTSPDHGTAFDLMKNQNEAQIDPRSLFAALMMAGEMSVVREKSREQG